MSQDRKGLALNAIKASHNTEQGEYGIDLFVSHHLEEFSDTEWQTLLGKVKPSSSDVIEALVFKECSDSNVYDFTLPNDVTDYVVSVSFNDGGDIDSISMES